MRKQYNTRLDRVDLDHVNSVRESPGFKLIQLKIGHMLDTLRQDLETRTDDVRFVQGQIAATRRVLEIPDILAKEIASTQKD